MKSLQDNLVTDVERIKRAKRIIEDNYVDRHTKEEAYRLIRIYRELTEYIEINGTDEERERAKEILHELPTL